MKTVAQNRRARFDYEIVETIEGGIILSGPEVKSCRRGSIHLAGSYVSLRNRDAILRNATIAPYPFAKQDAYDPTQDRVLLLTKKEHDHLRRAIEEKGVTVIPLEVRAGKYIKLLIGLGRGRKKYDKRDRIRERETVRQMQRGSV